MSKKKTFFRPRGCLLLVIELVRRGSSSILLIPFLGAVCICPKNSATAVCEAKNYMKYIILHKILGCFVKKYIKFYKLHEILHFFLTPQGKFFQDRWSQQISNLIQSREHLMAIFADCSTLSKN